MSKKESRETKVSISTEYRLITNGNKEILLEGCKGIIKYESEEICLNVGPTQVRILGNDLTIPVLERHSVQVQGEIYTIEFS